MYGFPISLPPTPYWIKQLSIWHSNVQLTLSFLLLTGLLVAPSSFYFGRICKFFDTFTLYILIWSWYQCPTWWPWFAWFVSFQNRLKMFCLHLLVHTYYGKCLTITIPIHDCCRMTNICACAFLFYFINFLLSSFIDFWIVVVAFWYWFGIALHLHFYCSGIVNGVIFSFS